MQRFDTVTHIFLYNFFRHIFTQRLIIRWESECFRIPLQYLSMDAVVHYYFNSFNVNSTYSCKVCHFHHRRWPRAGARCACVLVSSLSLFPFQPFATNPCSPCHQFRPSFGNTPSSSLAASLSILSLPEYLFLVTTDNILTNNWLWSEERHASLTLQRVVFASLGFRKIYWLRHLKPYNFL